MNYSLWPACVKTHNFVDQLAAARDGGFNRLPVGGLTVRKLQRDGLSLGDIRQLADDSGVTLGHYDGFSAWAPQRYAPDLIAEAKAVFDFSADDCLEICSALGLDAICAAGPFRRDQFAAAELADSFGTFCQRAAGYGIRVDLEFIPMWGIPSLADAWDIVRQSGAGNAGILFDTWHFCRGDMNFSLLEALPPGAITAVQLADAKPGVARLSLLEECLRFRRAPGEGYLPLARILSILQNKGGVLDWGPEVFSDELDQLSARDAAQWVAKASTNVLETNGGLGGKSLQTSRIKLH